jgi:hypothetical protein
MVSSAGLLAPFVLPSSRGLPAARAANRQYICPSSRPSALWKEWCRRQSGSESAALALACMKLMDVGAARQILLAFDHEP